MVFRLRKTVTLEAPHGELNLTKAAIVSSFWRPVELRGLRVPGVHLRELAARNLRRRELCRRKEHKVRGF